MTEPSTVNQTFDTSLIDTRLQAFERSFSSTETDTSGSNPAHPQATSDIAAAAMPAPQAEPFTAVSNAELYDAWAETYDTDGNVLQAVDDLEMARLLPDFVRSVIEAQTISDGQPAYLKILDFGCGTGRNTSKLLQADWSSGAGRDGMADKIDVEVHGWDASAAMLDLARQKCSAVQSSAQVRFASLQHIDFGDASAISASQLGTFDAIISTLVLEHLSLDVFFRAVASLLKPGGYALVTSMHPDMGRSTRAGYKTSGGERVKGESWVHGVDESLRAAEEAGLKCVGGVTERSVDVDMIERGEVGERGRKWVDVRVWYGFVVRKSGG